MDEDSIVTPTHSLTQAETDSTVATKRLSSSQTLIFVHGARSLIFGRVCPRIPLNLAAVEILAKRHVVPSLQRIFFRFLVTSYARGEESLWRKINNNQRIAR